MKVLREWNECKYQTILELKDWYKKKGQLKIIHISHLPITKSGWIFKSNQTPLAPVYCYLRCRYR